MANFVADAEEHLINKLARDCRTIDGITTAFDFAQNPQSLVGKTPCVVFYPSLLTSDRKAHPNRWMNEIGIRGLLFVTERMSKSGILKFIENEALVFPGRFRAKFQTRSVYNDYLTLGVQVADMSRMQYGAGDLLHYMGTDYIGFIIDWEFRGTN